MNDARHKSAARLIAKLAYFEAAGGMYRNEALYKAQIDYTCQLLDIVDELADEVTAALITDTIAERLTDGGVAEAAQRQRDAKAEFERLMRHPARLPLITGNHPRRDGATFPLHG